MNASRLFVRVLVWSAASLLPVSLDAQSSASRADPDASSAGLPDVEWPSYGGDLANARYSPLEQIDAGNFASLEIAWRFRTDNLGPNPETNFQSTPLMVGGVLYTTAGSRRAVVALDAASGELLWMYRMDEGERGAAAPRRLSGRGLAYWADPAGDRIFYVTPGYRLVALDALTGRPVTSFGQAGLVDLKEGLDQEVDPVTGEVGLHAAPVVARGIVVVGAAHLPGGTPRSRTNVKGYVRGYDARTGERKWIFHTIPLPGEPGQETWLEGSAAYTGNTGLWTQPSIDEELGLAYLPLEIPTGDYYGGHRPGDNLYGSSLVAVELATGRKVWHQQLVHHDIWDFDLPSAPVLADVTVDGRARRVVAQPTKQGFLFVFDRETGEPVWPIEERPVARGDVPGEWYAPTQPFPTKPAPFERQGIGPDDLIDFTPGLKAEALDRISRYRAGPLFTPPSLSTWEGTLGTLHVPSVTGGANWPGASYDPGSGVLFIYSKTEVSALGLIRDPERSDMDWIQGRAPPPPGVEAPRGSPLAIRGLPLVKPPWGRITAYDLNTGEILWQVAHGETPDDVKDHPDLQGLHIPRTGRPGRIATLTTGGLVIAGEGGFATTPSGERGAMLRAYEKASGREVGEVYMPAPQTGSPMTYLLDGVQYLVVAVGGPGHPGELVAYRLPEG